MCESPRVAGRGPIIAAFRRPRNAADAPSSPEAGGAIFQRDPGNPRVEIAFDPGKTIIRPISTAPAWRRVETPVAAMTGQDAMRVIVTSDLHYNIARSKRPTRALAEEILRIGGDILVFAGDTSGGAATHFEEAFGLFEGFRGPRLAIAGNHDIWVTGGADSLHRYENELREICSQSGVHYLDAEPFYADGAAIVGNMGWYDFSLRPASLRIPLRFYQSKVAPGAAERLGGFEGLFAGAEDVRDETLEITTRWMDGERVNLAESDVAFTHRLAGRFRRHLSEASERAERICAIVHHVPFAELVPHSILPNWEFATAFHGSELFGEIILEFSKVRRVFCGHIHKAMRCRRGDFEATSIGSTYKEKAYEIYDL